MVYAPQSPIYTAFRRLSASIYVAVAFGVVLEVVLLLQCSACALRRSGDKA